MQFLRYRKSIPYMIWPKSPIELSQAQLDAREKYMMLWHKELPKKYGIIEKFNHGSIASLPLKENGKTLEVGAGLGSHCNYENLEKQEYTCLEYREEFCVEIRKSFPGVQASQGDIHFKQKWADQTFDRIIAVHVLEHLRDLPSAINEISRLLKNDGFFDIVIPCEGGIAHTFARKVSAERLFRKNFNMDFTPIHLNEHVNSYDEVIAVVRRKFKFTRQEFFPLKIPIPNLNLCASFRLQKK